MRTTPFVDYALVQSNRVDAAWLNAVDFSVSGVATIAALKALVPPEGTIALNVRGYYAVGDGGEGLFWYDPLSVAADNGGTVIAPDSGSGRWLRVGDIVAVEQFGVSASASAAFNQAAIQAALDSADRVAFAPNAAYSIGATGLKLKRSGQQILGNNATIEYSGIGSAIDSDLENATTYPQNVRVENLVIACTGVGATGFNCRNSYSSFHNIWIYLQADSQTGWRLTDSAVTNTQVYESLWTECFVIGAYNGTTITAQTGWVFDQFAGSQLGPNDNTFLGGRTTACSLGWSVRGAGNKIFVGVEGVPSGGRAFYVSNGTGVVGVGCTGNVIWGNLEGAAGAVGYYVDSTATDTHIRSIFGTGFAPAATNFFQDLAADGTTVFDAGAVGTGQYGTGFKLANSSLSALPNVLDYYLEGSFLATFTGFDAAVTATVNYVRIGNKVILDVPAITGTSNATTKTMTGLPVHLVPVSAKRGPAAVKDNGAAYAWGMWVLVGDVMTFATTPNSGAFTATGTAAVRDFQAEYTLA